MSNVHQIFKKHHDYYKSLGIETIQQQSGQAEQVSADYQGRVLFELLQNAFDKAKNKIAVTVIDNTLYIANDGEKFSYNANHDYRGANVKRYDFQSLCSISTSSKIDAKSIGNKGVGFKSVFSLAKDGFVNIHTIGNVVDNSLLLEEQISFCVYESFKSASQIPNDIEDEVKQSIIEKLNAVQIERKDRGIPGFYFPIPIQNSNTVVQNFLANGYITVIEIPFEDQNVVDELFKEIQSIHFEFIRLKHEKDITISFKNYDLEFSKEIKENNEVFTADLKRDQLELLAKEAGVELEDNVRVAFSYNPNGEGLFYNYLPTKEKNPFKFLDFQGDFRTTVDRKSIDFDVNSKIGKYNNFLLRGCIELFFRTLNESHSESQQVKLNIRNISSTAIPLNKKYWNWSVFQIEKRVNKPHYHYTRDILRIDDSHVDQWNYNNNLHYLSPSQLIAQLAKEKFELYSSEDRSLFFKSIQSITNTLTDDYNKSYSRSRIFKLELTNQLRQKKVQFLPDVNTTVKSEILYREDIKTTINIPDFLGIQITTFNIPDDNIREGLGIRKYSDPNVLLRYFRQVSIQGEVSPERITETQQKELLASLFEIFLRKESTISFANRYQTFLTVRERENNSLLNNAKFSVSTVFLRLNNGKYKPAQLCANIDLDYSFLPVGIESQINDFLIFLGVSPEKNYRIVDGLIYDKLNEGLDYCPMPWTKESSETLSSKLILANIRVITPKSQIHPALINYNQYGFLENISNNTIKRHLTALKIGDFSEYPEEFSDILLNVVRDSLTIYPDDVFRFYSSNIFPLFQKRNEYLIVNKNKFEWTRDTNFIIAKSRMEYEILKNYPLNLLAHFNNNELNHELRKKHVFLKIEKVQLTDEQNITEAFKKQIEPFIPFLLIDISKLNASVSQRDYLQDPQLISDLQRKWNELTFIEGSTLVSEIIVEPSLEKIQREERSQFYSNTFYFRKDASNSDKANAMANHFFDISSFADRIELTFFHKNIEEFEQEYDQNDLELINKFWISTYWEKYNDFQNEILLEFGVNHHENPDWYIYNDIKKSDFLIKLDQENKLNLLERRIELVKQKEEFNTIFSSFQLRINRKHIQDKCSELLLLLEGNNLNFEKSSELKALSMRLGVEDILTAIQRDLRESCIDNDLTIGNELIDQKSKELDLEFKIKSIFENSTNNTKPVESIVLSSSNNGSHTIEKNQNQRIYTANGSYGATLDLEAFGASGEEEVLSYFIKEFMKIEDVNKRKKGIEEVYNLLQLKLNNDSLLKYKIDCLNKIEVNTELQKALIPLFYVTLHHKFSFFDLIVYYNEKPTLVEVKTTNNNNRFFISKAEINAARTEENYLLVRNTSQRIELLGNPIKQFEDQFKMIQGDRITIVPSNYEIILHNLS